MFIDFHFNQTPSSLKRANMVCFGAWKDFTVNNVTETNVLNILYTQC